MHNLIELSKALMKNQHFDALAVGIVDFSKKEFESFELVNGVLNNQKDSFFDLASLTKPLTLSLSYLLKPEVFTDDMKLLLNHRGGLPAISRLSKSTYKDDLLRYKITESKTEYSDLSAIRLMLEIEARLNKPLYEIVRPYYDKDLLSHLQLDKTKKYHSTGMRHHKEINGIVNDDNAFNINAPLTNAGLFSTIDGLIKTLINIDEKVLLIEKMRESILLNKGEFRFVNGFDTVSNIDSSLAGVGCSLSTFGHLGFTGTSIWIDPELNAGHIILTNATKNYWYDRAGLNKLRKSLGKSIWEKFES